MILINNQNQYEKCYFEIKTDGKISNTKLNENNLKFDDNMSQEFKALFNDKILFEIDFIDRNEILLAIYINCLGPKFTYCEDNQFFSPVLDNFQEDLDDKKFKCNRLVTKEHKQITFTFPELIINNYFPSQQLTINLPLSKYCFKNVINENFQLTTYPDNNLVFCEQSDPIEYESFVYYNENKDEEWFYLFEMITQNYKIYYFKNYCMNFEENNIIYNCTKLSVDCSIFKEEVTFLTKNAEIKCQEDNIILYYFFNDIQTVKENWEKCAKINYYYNNSLNIFIIKRNDNKYTLHSNDSRVKIPFENCENFLNICDDIGIRPNNANNEIQTLVCNTSKQCIGEQFLNDEMKNIFFKIDAVINCGDGNKFLFRHYSEKFKVELLEDWEICSYIVYKYTQKHYFYKIEINNFKVYKNDSQNDFEEILCKHTYLKDCTTLTINNNNNKYNVTCFGTFTDENTVQDIFLSNNNIELIVNLNNGSQFIYHSKNNANEANLNWEICSEIYYLINESFYSFRIFKKKKTDSNYSLYSINNKSELNINICERKELTNCKENLWVNFSTNPITIYCYAKLDKTQILSLFPVNNFQSYELIINCVNCSGKKIINYHNYNYFSNLDYKSKWEICSQLIHLFYHNTYFIIERDYDNDNDFEIYDSSKKKQFNDCEPYFKNCNISFNISKKYNKEYIYCVSNDSCSNLIIALNNNKLIDHEIYCGINQEKILYFHLYNYFGNNVSNWENWEYCSYIYYLTDKNNYKFLTIEKNNDESDKEYLIYKNDDFTQTPLDQFICKFHFLYNCSKNLKYIKQNSNNLIECESELKCDDIERYFNISEEDNAEFTVSCDKGKIYYHYYNYFENLENPKHYERCSYLLNYINNEKSYFRIKETNNKNIIVYHNNQSQSIKICDSPFLIYCTYLIFGEMNNFNYAICNISLESNYSKLMNEINNKKMEKLELYLHYDTINYSYYHIYNFSLDENNIPKWEACCLIYKILENNKYFLITGDLNKYDDDTNFKILRGENYQSPISNDICFPRIKEQKYYGQLNRNITLILDDNLVEPLIPNYSGFGFDKLNKTEGIIYYFNAEIINSSISHLTYVFNYFHVNENISLKKLDFILYFKKTEMIRGIINITIFPDFCETDINLFKNNSCKIFKSDNDILQILINSINSPLLYNKIFYGVNSVINIYNENQMDTFSKECWSDLTFFYNQTICLIRIDKTYQINDYFIGNITKIIYDQFVCNNFILNDLSTTINYNYTLDIRNLFEPSIKKLENIPENFFQISIDNTYDLKGEIFYSENNENNYNNIVYENKIFNLSKIKYGIKYNHCFYKEKFEIQLFKNKKKQGNKAIMDFEIYPSFCQTIQKNEICITNKTKDEIFNIIHKNSINITCLFPKVIREINRNYTIQIYDLNNNSNIMTKTILLEEECETKIRNKYSLSKNDKIIILIYENKKSNEFLYEIYNEKGEQLDISICEKYILINPIENIILSSSKVKNVKKLGYDVFDEESPIYQDTCISLSVNGNDVILDDRKTEIYNVINPCLKECKYKNFEENSGIVYCDCYINYNIENEEYSNDTNTDENKNETKNKNQLLSNFKNINIKPVYCYNLLFKMENYTNNYGFWIFSFFIIAHIISFYSLYKYEFVSLKAKIFKVDQNKADLNINENNDFIYIKKKNIIHSTLSSSRTISKMKKNKKIKRFYNNHKNDFIIMNKFSYKLAIANDKRPFTIIFLDILSDKLLLLKGIYKKTPFYLRTLNISLFILNLSLVFLLNGLFYTDQIISEKYHNNGLSLLTNILRSVLSSIISLFIFSTLNKISDYSAKLYSLLHEYNDQSIYSIITFKFFSKLTKRFFIYFIIVLLLSFSFLYYITLFCSLYKGSQKSWIQGALTSILISNIGEIMLCLITAMFRIISLVKENEYLYNIYLFIYNKI